ncbi:hypothetical protein KSP35_19645 [Aquihabitans sp. G128]|uniref:hypothetical protein n=1 Tax=Aquihabitans sp. G128 TaxID=2849779 RepID=UPI001C2502A3|nr:hypothetical protein [Aquihabitans sp. G128]QXC60513.1 hypothetical protein KSP35_19645 [Aquihabitans sp. G128]
MIEMTPSPFSTYEDAHVDEFTNWVSRKEPELRVHATASDRACDLVEPVVAELRASGIFRLAQPRSAGGWEADPIAQICAIEALSTVDAALGWATCIGTDTGYYAARLGDPTPLTDNVDAVTSGFTTPAGRGDRACGGYVLDGIWPLATLITHADVVVAGFKVDGEGDERVAVLDPDQIVVANDWTALGMRGTGSHSYEIHEMFVPDRSIFDFTAPPSLHERLYSHPRLYRLNLAGVPIGLTRASLRDARRAAPLIGSTHRREVDDLIAGFACDQHDAEMHLFDSVATLWAELALSEEPSETTAAALTDGFARTFRTCVQLHRALLDVAPFVVGPHAAPFTRRIADALTMSHHAIVRRTAAAACGGPAETVL